MKRITIIGICGKMGISIANEMLKEKNMKIVGGIDIVNTGQDIGKITGNPELKIKVSDDYENIKSVKTDIIIDFTNADAAKKSIFWALENSVDIIVGTTGFKKEEIGIIREKTLKANSKVFLVPNFSIGAVVMIKTASIIAKYFDNCEIIELHHDKKKDAPSGTAMLTAQTIAEAKKFKSNINQVKNNNESRSSRGLLIEGIRIHSVRMPGLLAHQEILFGTAGQTLSIRHDSIDRLAFYPGVLLAIKSIDKLGKFTYGLDKIIVL